MDEMEAIMKRQKRLEQENLIYQRLKYEMDHGIATFDDVIKIFERSNQYGRNTSSSRDR